jgi:hypothetical protein
LLTTTKAGLKVESALDTMTYEKGIKFSDAEMWTLDIQGDQFHPEWNYAILEAGRKLFLGEAKGAPHGLHLRDALEARAALRRHRRGCRDRQVLQR